MRLSKRPRSSMPSATGRTNIWAICLQTGPRGTFSPPLGPVPQPGDVGHQPESQWRPRKGRQ